LTHLMAHHGVNVRPVHVGWELLSELVLKAEARGITVGQSWAHFAPTGSCTPPQLFSGMQSLGLVATISQLQCQEAVDRFGDGGALKARGFAALLGLDVSPPDVWPTSGGAVVSPIIEHQCSRSSVDQAFELVEEALSGRPAEGHLHSGHAISWRALYHSLGVTCFMRLSALAYLLLALWEEPFFCVGSDGDESYVAVLPAPRATEAAPRNSALTERRKKPRLFGAKSVSGRTRPCVLSRVSAACFVPQRRA